MAGQRPEPEADERRRDHELDPLPQLAERLDDVAEADARREALDEADALLLGRGEDLAYPEQADRDRHEADPREQADLPEREARLTGDGVEADRGEQQPEADHHHGLRRCLGAEPDERGEREDEHREELGRPEREREVRDGLREEREQHRREERADERGEERGRQRDTWLPLALRQGEAIEQEHDGPRLSRDVEQDRGHDAAEERAPVHAGEEDHRARRAGARDDHGDRQQDRDGARAAEAGEHADDESERDPDQQHEDVERLERGPEAAREVAEDVEEFHRLQGLHG